MERSIAIVGAGLSGLVAARRLADAGARVTVFDKARGPGGRIATRRTGPYAFDLGAQYFTIRTPQVRALLEGWLRAGVVAPWRPRLVALSDGAVRPWSRYEERYVGVPRMSALSRHLARDLDLRAACRITRIRREDDAWHVEADEVVGAFDGVLVATPPEQAVALLSEAPALARIAGEVESDPCWAAMLVFPRALAVPFDAAFVHDSPVAWAARDTSKPGRGPEDAWVLHASREWSRSHLEDEAAEVAHALTRAFLQAAGCTGAAPTWLGAHRWALAAAANPREEGVLWDADRRIGVCGDWCAGRRVEAALLSGLAAAERLADVWSQRTGSAASRA